jgi:ubiquitin carboxyl-terminal hydrolase 34
MLFDLLVYSSNNETIKEVADVFRKILAASDEAVLQFSDFIIKDDCSEMIRILLKCPDH